MLRQIKGARAHVQPTTMDTMLLRGRIFTHNHPGKNDFCFSVADIGFAYLYETAQMRLVSGGNVYAIRPGDKNKPFTWRRWKMSGMRIAQNVMREHTDWPSFSLKKYNECEGYPHCLYNCHHNHWIACQQLLEPGVMASVWSEYADRAGEIFEVYKIAG